jgi:hypothetical protein
MKAFSLFIMCARRRRHGDRAGPSVRPLDLLGSAAFDLRAAPIGHFRALVTELEDQRHRPCRDHPELPLGVLGTTRFVALLEGWRYVRVHLAQSLTPKLRVAMLAHELQHACELARSSAASPDAVRALYRAIGTTPTRIEDFFETADAEQSGWTVWEELGGGGLRAHDAER